MYGFIQKTINYFIDCRPNGACEICIIKLYIGCYNAKFQNIYKVIVVKTLQ